jgi:hypothetical protein
MLRKIAVKSKAKFVSFDSSALKKRPRPSLNLLMSAEQLEQTSTDILNRYASEPSTRLSHIDSYNAWIRFTINSGRPDCQISSSTLRQFVIYEHLRGVTSDTSKVRLGGIGKTVVKKGLMTTEEWNRMRQSDELRETREAIKKLENKLGYEHRRADPISIGEVEVLAMQAKKYDDIVLSLTVATAFFGLTRMGELVDNSAKKLKDVLRLPRFANLDLRDDSVSFVIQSSKTASWQEKNVDIEKCPKWYLELWRKYVTARGELGLKYSPYLFVLQDGKAPTTGQINDYLKEMVSRNLTTHSCRAGGATYMAICGASFIEIMLAGRWNSWAFIQYIRCLSKMEKAMKASGSLPPGYRI